MLCVNPKKQVYSEQVFWLPLPLLKSLPFFSVYCYYPLVFPAHFSYFLFTSKMSFWRICLLKLICLSTSQIIERFNWRLPGYIGHGNDRYSFSHVDDVVEGHIAAMERGQPGERYLLTGENASFKDVFDLAAIITKTNKPRFCIPMWVIEAYGWISVLLSRITGKLPLLSPPVYF